MSPRPLHKAAAAGRALPLISPLCPHFNYQSFAPPGDRDQCSAACGSRLLVPGGCTTENGEFQSFPLAEEQGWPLPLGQTLALILPAKTAGAGDEQGVQGSSCRCPRGAQGEAGAFQPCAPGWGKTPPSPHRGWETRERHQGLLPCSLAVDLRSLCTVLGL